jgi:hypothetical protein
VLPSVDQVFQQLTSGDRRVRQESIRSLIDLGPDAQTLLTRLLERDLSPEARKNVELAAEQIRQGQQLGPSQVTLHLADASPARILAELSKQSNGPLPTWPDNLFDQQGWPNLSVDYDRQPFWNVLQQVSKKMGVDYLGTDPQEIRIARQSWRSPGATCVSGAFLIAADATTMRNGMIIELSVYGEPKLVVTRADSFKIDKAEDDHGNPLLPQTSRRFWGRRFRSGSRRLPMTFQRPPEEVSRIGSLQGTITAVVETSTQVWEIDKPLKMDSETRVVDSVPVTIEGLSRQNDGNYELQLKVPPGWSSRGAQDELSELIHKRMQIIDGHGTSLSLNSVDVRNNGEGTVVADFVPPPHADGSGSALPAADDPLILPAKIRWNIPAGTQNVTIPFQLKDLAIGDGFN